MEFKYNLESNQRLDQYLSQMIDTLSRERIKSHIKDSLVKVNGIIITKPNHTLSEGDVVEISIQEAELNVELKP